MDLGLLFFIIIIVLGCLYAFYVGANDSANSIAASISCRALSPNQAITLASALTFAGAFFGTEVAMTIGRGIVPEDFMTTIVVTSAITGAVLWTAVATRSGVPVSMTHSLIGGIMGAGIVAYGVDAVNWEGLNRVVTGLIASPIGGFIGGIILVLILLNILKNMHPHKANTIFKRSQIFSTSFLTFSFGMNNTQNAVGVMAAGLFAVGFTQDFEIPIWLTMVGAFFISAGIFLGGRRVIKVTGMRLSNIKPVHGFSADTASGAVIFTASLMGIPISTTHVAVSAIMGVGSSKRISAVRWGIAGNIVAAWVITIPAAALIAAAVHNAIRIFI